MLDTVSLVIPARAFSISQPERFFPPANWLGRWNSGANRRSTLNPSPRYKKENGYTPRLTLFRNPRGTYLQVEASLPKVVYGNNLSELTNEDLPRVVARLHELLSSLGVEVAPEQLEFARVSRIHYSKNIKLPDSVSPSMAINELEKLNLSAHIDINKASFRNGGHALTLHANLKEVTFYDKYRDIKNAERSPKRSIGDAEAAIDQAKYWNVLRFEVRLNAPRVIRDALRRSGIRANLTLGALFSSLVAKAVLTHELQLVEGQLHFLGVGIGRPMDRFEELQADNPELASNPKLLLATYAALDLMQDGGARRLRASLERSPGGRRFWYGLDAKLKQLHTPKRRPFMALTAIASALHAFTPLRL